MDMESADLEWSAEVGRAFLGGGARSGLMDVSRGWNPCQSPRSSHKAVSLLLPLDVLVVLMNSFSGSPTLILSPPGIRYLGREGRVCLSILEAHSGRWTADR